MFSCGLSGNMHRNDRIIVSLGIIMLLVALIGAALGGSPKITEDVENGVEDFRDWPLQTISEGSRRGSSTEQSDQIEIFNITESYVTQVTIELRWLDEAPDYSNFENQPDEFNFTVYTPWDAEIGSIGDFNAIGAAGQIIEIIKVPEEGIEQSSALGEWKINIHCGNCGDQTLSRPNAGVLIIEDNGNDWTLTFKYEFHTNN